MTDESQPIARSYLYVPGHREEMIRKALGTEAADAVVIDLEDGVPEANRSAARALVKQVMRSPPPRPVWVRINPATTAAAQDDVEAAAGPHLAGIRLAKTESAGDAAQAAGWLRRAGCAARISCLLESALALERAYEIATADPGVTGIALGEADLGADLGTLSDDGLLYARARCVAASRAAGLASPVQSVYTHLTDEGGLQLSSEHGRDLGFFGRSAIHPRQLAIINAVYTPSPEEVRQARSIVQGWAAAADDDATLATSDGRLLDPAVVRTARRTLALAEGLEARV